MLNVSEKPKVFVLDRNPLFQNRKWLWIDFKLPLTTRRATWLILRREENQDSEDQHIIEKLQSQNPVLSLAKLVCIYIYL